MKQELEVSVEKYKPKVVDEERGKLLRLITGDLKVIYSTKATGQ